MEEKDRRFTEDQFRLAEERLNAIPHYMELSIGGKNKTFTREDIRQHLEKRDEIGEMFVELQMETIKSFTEV